MGDRFNIEKHCSSLAENLRSSCEYLARECLDQSSRGVRDFTLPTPKGDVEITHDLKSCIDSARSIPSNEGPLSHQDESDSPQDSVPEFGKPRSGFRLSLGEGYQYLTVDRYLESARTNYHGNFTQLNIGHDVLSSGRSELVVSSILRHSYLNTSEKNFGSLQAYQFNLQIDGGTYLGRQNIGVHWLLGGGLTYLTTEDYQVTNEVSVPTDFKLGGDVNAGLGISFFTGSIKLLAAAQMIFCKADKSIRHTTISGEYIEDYEQRFITQGFMLGLFFGIPELVDLAQGKARERRDRILESHGM